MTDKERARLDELARTDEQLPQAEMADDAFQRLQQENALLRDGLTAVISEVDGKLPYITYFAPERLLSSVRRIAETALEKSKKT